MADYNQSDVNSMRQDAIRRVQEMQRRSQGYINQSFPKPQEKPVPPKEENLLPNQSLSRIHNGRTARIKAISGILFPCSWGILRA